MTLTRQEKENLGKKFQDFADSIVWSNDIGDEKYIGVGNMADWWFAEIDSLLLSQQEKLKEEVEQLSWHEPAGADRYVSKNEVLALLSNKKEI